MDDDISEVNRPTYSKNSGNNKLTFFQKIKGFLSSPSATFQKVKNEDFGESFKYYLILVIVLYGILSVVFSIILQYLIYSFFTSNPYYAYSNILGPGTLSYSSTFNIVPSLIILAILLGYLFTIVGAILSYFIGGLWVHLWVYIFGGRKGISQTLKAYGYGSTPTLVLGWIPIISIIFSIWTLILFTLGIRELHEISTGKAVAAVLIAILIPIAIIVAIAATIYVYISGMLSG